MRRKQGTHSNRTHPFVLCVVSNPEKIFATGLHLQRVLLDGIQLGVLPFGRATWFREFRSERVQRCVAAATDGRHAFISHVVSAVDAETYTHRESDTAIGLLRHAGISSAANSVQGKR